MIRAVGSTGRATRVVGAVLLSLGLVAPAAVVAQDTAAEVHPAHIHVGACPAPGEVVVPLSPVSAEFAIDGERGAVAIPFGSEAAPPVKGSTTTLPLRPAQILADAHSIVVHASTDDLGTYLVCGDIGGRSVGGEMPIALHPVGDSGHAGVAVLRSVQQLTTLTIYLVATDAGGPEPSVAPSDGPSPAPSAVPSAVPVVTEVSVGAELWWAGFGITVRDATLDPATGALEVEVELANEGTANRSPIELANRVFAVADGQPITLDLVGPTTLPAERATLVTLRGSGLPTEVVLTDLVLTFGTPDVRQATVLLAPGATGTFDAPRDVRVRGTVRVPGTARFTLRAARIVPAGCGGKSDAITYTPIEPDRESLVLTVREVGLARLGANVTAYLTGPGGLTFPADPGLTSIYLRQTNQGRKWCFTLPAPAAGAYRVTFETGSRRGSRTVRIP